MAARDYPQGVICLFLAVFPAMRFATGRVIHALIHIIRPTIHKAGHQSAP